ncbi:MobA/MobL family protein [Glacieibacterium frigidum]|uniref:MobA/MobL protein domain-containing protein n=1 Tax=Glacieibacterium frigidum TaxID=2593303 RepID=A0A552U9A9_9SPHN|nr:MobA/MobL family protein [Glacieibacterium frigidum]TRW14798.1 hypothetical protein FMM06_14050 [Glacieibacterium frigidum]
MTRRPFVCLPVSGQPVETGTHRFADASATSTALRESAYLRRTRYIRDDGSAWFDFTLRGADLVAIKMIRPQHAPSWTTSPFRVWSMADCAARGVSASDNIRAWQIVADLPPTMSPGRWLDDAIKLVTHAFRQSDAIVEIALHAPIGQVPHAHILVTARHLVADRFGTFDPTRAGIISGQLKKSWLRWLRRYRSALIPG